jgi:hypothetical protein
MEGPPHKRKYIVGILKNDVTKDTCIKDKYISFGFASSKRSRTIISKNGINYIWNIKRSINIMNQICFIPIGIK